MSTSALLVLLLMFWSGQPFGWISHHSNATSEAVGLWVMPIELAVISAMTGLVSALGWAMWRQLHYRYAASALLLVAFLGLVSLAGMSALWAFRATNLTDHATASWQKLKPDTLWVQYQQGKLDKDVYRLMCQQSVKMNLALTGERYKCHDADSAGRYLDTSDAAAAAEQLRLEILHRREMLHIFAAISGIGAMLAFALGWLGARIPGNVLHAFGGSTTADRGALRG